MTSTPAASHARILLVDDDAAVLRTYERRLRRAGHDVTAMTAADEAIKLVADRAFDVVVSDLQMPSIGGIELLRAIRTRDGDVPVLLMTGMPEVETAVTAFESGAMRYLFKPIPPDELEKQVAQAVLMGRLARVRREALEQVGADTGALDEQARVEARFQSALDNLWVAFQPIVVSSDRSVYAHEALLRTEEPTLRNPCEFIETAIRLGRYPELARSIRARIAATMSADPRLLFVNLHPRDLLDETLYSPESPLSAHARRVVLEITERASLEEVVDVRARVGRLRALGYRIAVDDLGAGYAGLSTFAQLEPDIVKLDMCLVRGCDASPTKQKIIRSLAELSRELGIRTVMEGIETEAERETLVQIGADLFQGYLFGRPRRELSP